MATVGKHLFNWLTMLMCRRRDEDSLDVHLLAEQRAEISVGARTWRASSAGRQSPRVRITDRRDLNAIKALQLLNDRTALATEADHRDG